MKQKHDFVDSFSVVIAMDQEATDAMRIAENLGFSRESITKYALKLFLTNIHRTHIEEGHYV